MIPAKESSPIRHTYILGNKYKLELCGHSEFNRLTSRGRGFRIVVTQWNAGDYAKNSQGQFAWALTLMERMDFAPDAYVLDIGCGDGKVSVEIARRVPDGRVLGVDNSPDMIELAQRTWCSRFPNVEFRVADAQTLHAPRMVDFVFSNSTMHWIPDHLSVLRGVAAALKPGGRLVFSMGGRGTASVVYSSLGELTQLERWRRFLVGAASPHHFCGSEDYNEWLPQVGLTPRRIALVPKPMRHADQIALKGWLRTTWVPYTSRIPEDRRAQFVDELTERIRAKCDTDENGTISLPMINLEVEAEKVAVPRALR